MDQGKIHSMVAPVSQVVAQDKLLWTRLVLGKISERIKREIKLI